MNKRWLQIGRCVSALLTVVLLCGSLSVGAASAYRSYTYDSYGNAVESPNVYEVEQVVYGTVLDEKGFVMPEDLCAGPDGRLYVLDSGNNRVVVLDGALQPERIIADFTLDGEPSPLKKPTSLTVDAEGRLYIADRGNNRVVCVRDNAIEWEITKPESEIFASHVEFLPTKLVLDRAGNLYVQCTGIYQGLVIFDADRVFQGFFGSETVTTTSQAIQTFIWKQFLTDEQKENMSDFVPNEIRNMDVTDAGFIVTLTNASYLPGEREKMGMDSIRKLNPKGEDTLVSKMAEGAHKAMVEDAKNITFIDLCVDSREYITAVDGKLGKIYRFDKNMNLVTAFGALGDQAGTFRNPVAIETLNDRLLVLDTANGSITVLGLTRFGEKVHTALDLYGSGKYEAAVQPWQEVLAMDANYELAHIGIGNAYYNQGKYAEAMEEYSLARDSIKYNDAFRENRLLLIRDNFPVVAVLVVILLIGSSIRKTLKKRREKAAEQR